MVKWSVPAKNDLKQIHDDIANDSKYYAQNVIQEYSLPVPNYFFRNPRQIRQHFPQSRIERLIGVTQRPFAFQSPQAIGNPVGHFT
jgi:hypothetical protein